MEFAEALPRVEKLIRAKARRAAAKGGPQDVDDLVQEGFIVLVTVLERWDGQRPLHKMLGFYLDNHYRSLARAAKLPCRIPHVEIQYVDGSWHKEPLQPEPLDVVDDPSPSVIPSPEEALLQLEDARKAKVARIRIRRRLTPLQAQVFDMWVQPSPALLALAWQESGTHSVKKIHIASYLGVNERAVEYSFRKIREACRQVLGFLPAQS